MMKWRVRWVLSTVIRRGIVGWFQWYIYCIAQEPRVPQLYDEIDIHHESPVPPSSVAQLFLILSEKSQKRIPYSNEMEVTAWPGESRKLINHNQILQAVLYQMLCHSLRAQDEISLWTLVIFMIRRYCSTIAQSYPPELLWVSIGSPQHPEDGRCQDKMASNHSLWKNCLYPEMPQRAATREARFFFIHY